MSNYRLATLLASESIATAGTKTIDLDITSPISAIMAIHKATSAGTVMSAHPAANLTKIEAIDGSTVMGSLSGKQAQALDYWRTGIMPPNFICDVSGVMAYVTCNMSFGRHLWDKDYALDPTRFDNPQLKITHNYRASDAAASAGTLEVYGLLFDEKKISPAGYIRPTEYYSYTCGAEGSIETVDLPRDMPIKQAVFCAPCNDYLPWQVANKIKIEENGGAKVPYDFSTSAWLKHVNHTYQRAIEPAMIAVNATARDVYCAPSFETSVQLMPEAVTNIISKESVGHAVPFTLDSTASGNADGRFEGWNPHSSFPIPFGDQTDPLDWYNAPGLGSLKAKITAGSAGTSGTVSVVLEQLKRYQ